MTNPSWLIWSTLLTLLATQQTTSDFSQLIDWGEQQQVQRSVVVDAQSAVANQSLLALLPNKTYLRACEKPLTLYETRPIDPSKLSRDSPEYFITKCGCSGWYVYEAVSKTNLIMLIVNITSACRRCEPVAPPVSVTQLGNNFIPVLGSPEPETPTAAVAAAFMGTAGHLVWRAGPCYGGMHLAIVHETAGNLLLVAPGRDADQNLWRSCRQMGAKFTYFLCSKLGVANFISNCRSKWFDTIGVQQMKRRKIWLFGSINRRQLKCKHY